MTCEIRAVVVHVHGHEAEIDAFFDALDVAFEDVAKDAPLMWPSLAFIDEEDDGGDR